MSIQDILAKIDRLQSEINAHEKLSNDTLKKIQYRFRLDWNYNSNAMEGSTLTPQETRSVMVNNIDVNGKPLKDINEMRGHDNVVNEIFKMGKGEVRLSERRIKDVHAAIIYEDNPDKKTLIGKWKNANNEIINYRGEKYAFVDYSDVSEKMHELLNWLNTQTDKLKNGSNDAMHPVLLAFEFHLRFVTIHPFYDGNGRTSRIFMNIILISFGYPPAIVKLEEKDKYCQFLADIQAYGGNTDLLYEFLGESLIRSQELVLEAIAGKDISRPDDLDKKIELLKAEIAEVDKDNEVQIRFDKYVFEAIYDAWLSKLIKELIIQIRKFDELFVDPSHYITIKTNEHNRMGGQSVSVRFENKDEQSIVDDLKKELWGKVPIINADTEISLRAFYGTFKKGALILPFGCTYEVEIQFDYLKYEIYIPHFFEGNGPLITNETLELLTKNQSYKFIYFGEKGSVFSASEKHQVNEMIFENGEKVIAEFSREDIIDKKIKDRAMFRFREPRLLHKPFVEDEIDELVNQFGNVIFEHIDHFTKKQGIRK